MRLDATPHTNDTCGSRSSSDVAGEIHTTNNKQRENPEAQACASHARGECLDYREDAPSPIIVKYFLVPVS